MSERKRKKKIDLSTDVYFGDEFTRDPNPNTITYDNLYHEMLNRAVSAIAMDQGCKFMTQKVLSTLVEALQNLIISVGKTARRYQEHSLRMEPLLGDIICAFAELGISVTNLGAFAHHPGRTVTLLPVKQPYPKQPSLLRISPILPHKRHILNYLPPLPDGHTYIYTPAAPLQTSDYATMREKQSVQKRHLQFSLTKYLSRVYPTWSLLNNDACESDCRVPIPIKGEYNSYQKALLPTDQIFDYEQLEKAYENTNRKWPVLSDKPIDNPYLKKAIPYYEGANTLTKISQRNKAIFK